MSHRSKGWDGVVWMALLGTLGLGVWLRGSLAGATWSQVSFSSFAFLKHAHSHLGFFGVVFPIVWACWRERDDFFLAPRWMWLYLLGVVLSTIGFIRAGYGLDAIIGSSLVLLVWLVSAWRQRRLLWERNDWLALAPLGILLGSLCIPPIALLTRRDPALAALWVKTFLSVLLFLVALPAVLDRLSLRPPPRILWLLAGVSASLFLGVGAWPILGLGLVYMAVWILWALLELPGLPLELAAMWGLWSLGAMLLGMGFIKNSHLIGIAGLHFTLLGPFLYSAWWGLWRHSPPLWLGRPYLLWVMLLSTAIVAQTISTRQLFLLRVSALAGALVALWMLMMGGRLLLKAIMEHDSIQLPMEQRTE